MATQPVIGSTTVAWPASHVVNVAYRGGAVIMANGTQVTDLVNTAAKRRWTLGWKAITGTELASILTGVASIKDASGNYTDLNGTSYTATLDGTLDLTATSVTAAGGIRHDVSLALREA